MSQERTIPGCPWVFADEMRKLIDKKEFSDVRFIVGPNRKVVYANKCILATRCEVFQAMFMNQSKQDQKPSCQDTEVPLVLADVSHETFLSMLEFLYTNTCTLNSKNVMEVMGSAIEYGLDQLQKICEQYIGETLSIETACEAMQISVTYGHSELKEKCMEFIEEHTQEIFKTKSFHELSEAALILLLESDNLMMDEVEIVSAVKEWATVNSIVLGKSLAEVAERVVPYLRLALLTPDEIKEVESDNDRDRFIPVKQISSAWKYHALKKNPAHNVHRPVPRKGTVTRPKT